MTPDTSRIAELRRRVEADPESIAFAQLAEEYRRAGEHQEAVTCCRAGLTRHPEYLSARVTLGRALLAQGALDDAEQELGIVLRGSPDNLAAIRAMADLHHRRGALEHALEYYKRALALARFDPQLEETIGRIDREIAAVSESQASDSTRPAEPSVDFDALLVSLGAPDAVPPPEVEQLLSHPPPAGSAPAPVRHERRLDTDAFDVFARLEDDLRAFSRRTDVHTEQRIVSELEAWLRAIDAARTGPRSPRS